MTSVRTMHDMRIEDYMQVVTANYTALLHYLEGAQWSKAAEAAANAEYGLMRLGFVLNDVLRP